MDCGIPFCHQGCPLGNLIPDWNDLVYRDRWRAAIDRLHATNNFPGVHRPALPGAVRRLVRARHQRRPGHDQGDRGLDHRPRVRRRAGSRRGRPPSRTGKRVAVVGSGPAGLAAADQLNRAGHRVTVFERADRIGGLLRYGIPEFKMEKRVLDRRLALMGEEGVDVPHRLQRRRRRAGRRAARATSTPIVLAGGATAPRDLPVPGRELAGIHFAMEYLTQQNRRCEGDDDRRTTTVHHRRRTSTSIIIGGGDTGADCLGTAHRQGARAVHQLELLPRPPDARAANNPWPLWPNIFRVSSAHEEGGERALLDRDRSASSATPQGRVTALHGVAGARWSTQDGRADASSRSPAASSSSKADLVLLAMGFLGPSAAACSTSSA